MKHARAMLLHRFICARECVSPGCERLFFFRFSDCIGDQFLENKTIKFPHLLLWSVAMVTVCFLYTRTAESEREMSTQNHTEGHF